MKENILELGKLINSSNKILLISHKRMDPDTFGSTGALYFVLEKLGKNVKTINDDSSPESFAFMGANQIIEPDLDIKKFNPDLIIALDAGSVDQLGNTYKNNEDIIKNTPFVNIDHHLTNNGFGTLDIIDKKSSSTCEMIYEILLILDYKKYLDSQTATLLISGILTDTNMYYNTNTSPKTLKIASELLEIGADFRTSMFNFFKKKTFVKTKLWGEALKDIKKSKNGKIVWLTIKREIFEKTGSTDRDTAGLIGDFLACIEGVDVCFILYELENMEVKASFRSKIFDVSAFTKLFGGGGHKYAAGFTQSKKIEDIEKEILEGLEKEI